MASGIWIRPPRSPGKPREVWIVFRDASGQRRREKIGPDAPEARKLARDVLHKRQGEAIEGKHFPDRLSRSLTFSDLCEKYLRLWAPQCRSDFALDRISALPKDLLAMRAVAMRTEHIQEFYNGKAATTSGGNANRYLTLIKSVFNRAIEWGDFHKENPARKVKKRPESPGRLIFLSNDEMERLLGVCDPRLYPIVACALLTGMRRQELLGLEWQNVDMEHANIYILKAKSARPREIPMSGKLHALLTALGPKREGLVFPLSYMTFRRLWAKAQKAAGVGDFHFHDLRHTFASHFVMKTGDLPALQKILGHATMTMTLRYAHLAKGHLQSEMAVFDSSMPSLRGLDVLTGVGHQASHQLAVQKVNSVKLL